MTARLTIFAKQLRYDSTDAERLLWSRLRAHQMNGCKFKRQAPLGSYIVDFACFEEKLVVELDGGQHAEAVGKDRQRDQWLEGQGFRVLRFWNNEVLSNLDGVLMRILEVLSPSPQPLSHQGRGAIGAKASDDVTSAPLMGEGVKAPLPEWERGWGEGENCREGGDKRESESEAEGAIP